MSRRRLALILLLGAVTSSACIPEELVARVDEGGTSSASSASSTSTTATTTTGGATTTGAASTVGSGGAGDGGQGGGQGGGGEGGAGGSATPPPSCDGLDAICGPDGDADCCASLPLPGGTFDRADAGYPATLSAFRLDQHEITVGRFRRFVAAYEQDMIPNGAGRNPNDRADAGWDIDWNALLPADANSLRNDVICERGRATWSDAPGSDEARPINCITWPEALAFCVWDGGRLPTEAEWHFAAAGGDEQRSYPWTAEHDQTIDSSFAVYGSRVDTPEGVGSRSPTGDGRWGHADLAGNVAEWVLDMAGLLPLPCVDCARHALAGDGQRVQRGGGFADEADALLNTLRSFDGPSTRRTDRGARCARDP